MKKLYRTLEHANYYEGRKQEMGVGSGGYFNFKLNGQKRLKFSLKRWTIDQILEGDDEVKISGEGAFLAVRTVSAKALG